MGEIEIIFRSIRDFFRPNMLKIAILPLVITLILMYILFFTAAGIGFDSLQEVVNQSQSGGEVIIDQTAPFYVVWVTYLIVFLFKYSITSWLVGFLFYTVGSIFVLIFSVFLTLIIIGFLTPLIISILHKNNYSHLELKGQASMFAPLLEFIKVFFIMLLIFIILIPIYFIPGLNLIAFNLPFYYLFHKLLNFDVASTMLSKEEYTEIYKENSAAFKGRTLLLYLVSMIPFITLFSAVFYIIYLANAYFVKLEELRASKSSNKDSMDINKLKELT